MEFEIPNSFIEKYNMILFETYNMSNLYDIYMFFGKYTDDQTYLRERYYDMVEMYANNVGMIHNHYLIVCIDPDDDDVFYTMDKTHYISGDYKDTTPVKNGLYRLYPEIFNVDKLNEVKKIIEGQPKVKDMYRPRKLVRESVVLKLNDFENLEYRKGSKEYGGILTKLIEFLRLYKDDKEIIFNIDNFEKESNISIDEVKKLLKSKEEGKNLFDFNIIFEDDKIIFNNFDSGKTRPFESIRNEYEQVGVDDFYKKIGGEYRNPHFNDIRKSLKKINEKKLVDFSDVLDLSCGTGEVTTILNELGYYNVEGLDPYLCNFYEKNTGYKCLEYSFMDIKKGVLNDKNYSTIVCSYALHLADESLLSDIFWNLSLISKYLVIITPNRKPNVSQISWEDIDSFSIGKSKTKIYRSKNNK